MIISKMKQDIDCAKCSLNHVQRATKLMVKNEPVLMFNYHHYQVKGKELFGKYNNYYLNNNS